MKIPAGFGTVTPYLFVSDAETYIQFLVAALGAIEIGRSLRPDMKIANAQIQLGSSVLMLSEASSNYPPTTTSFYFYTDDAHVSVDRAIAAGATLEMEIADMPYGDRQGGVRDPRGNIWWISQRLVEAPYF